MLSELDQSGLERNSGRWLQVTLRMVHLLGLNSNNLMTCGQTTRLSTTICHRVPLFRDRAQTRNLNKLYRPGLLSDYVQGTHDYCIFYDTITQQIVHTRDVQNNKQTLSMAFYTISTDPACEMYSPLDLNALMPSKIIQSDKNSELSSAATRRKWGT